MTSTTATCAFVTLLTLLTFLTLAAPSHAQAGLTFDLCDTDSSCTAPRQCYDTSSSNLTLCTSSTVSVCVCYSESPVYCTESSVCSEGEICARTDDTPSSCYSEAAVESNHRLFTFDSPPPPVPVPTGPPGTPLWENVGSISRGAKCTEPLQCSSGLFCLSFSSASCNGPADNCRCIPRGSGRGCEDDGDCSNDDDVCVNVGSESENSCLPDDVATVVSPRPQPPTITPEVTAVVPVPQNSQPALPSVSARPTPFSSGDPVAVTMPPTGDDDSDDPEVSTTPVSVPREPIQTDSMGEDNGNAIITDGTDMTSSSSNSPDEDEEVSDIETSSSPDSTDTSSTSTETGATGDDDADDSTNNNTDVSPEDSTPPKSEICISVHHLSHLSKSDLIYSSHKHARVLCDQHLSCATPGHIVIYRKQPMMMSSYCELVHGGCKSSVKLVNSPRLSASQQRIASRSEDLQFTPLAARYATRIEERMLTLVMRFGF